MVILSVLYGNKVQATELFMYINWLIKLRHELAVNARLVLPVPAAMKVLVQAKKLTYKSHN